MIEDILNINMGLLEDFYLQANEVVDSQVEKILDHNLNRLRRVGESMQSEKDIKASAKALEEAIDQLKQAYKGKIGTVEWRDLRIISYNLQEITEDYGLYAFALQTYQDNWKDMYINGLVYSLMENWRYYSMHQRSDLIKLVTEKINDYEGPITRYNKLKDCCKWFSLNGTAELAKEIARRGVSLINAPSIFGNRLSSISQSYYSDVIVRYVRDNSIVDLNQIKEIFDVHKSDRTRKLVYAYLVEQAEREGSEIRQTLVSKSAEFYLGDITIDSTWAPFTGATNEDIARLENAKNLVRKWYVKKVIVVFFDVCVQDRARKDFWLGFVNHISNFKIAGSDYVRKKILADRRIGNSINKYFIRSSSAWNETAALVLELGDRMFVEFSDVGAAYSYKKGKHSMTKYIEKVIFNIDKVEDLKDTSMPMLVTENYGSYHYSEQGRIIHNGDWQGRLRKWIKQKLGFSYSTV